MTYPQPHCGCKTFFKKIYKCTLTYLKAATLQALTRGFIHICSQLLVTNPQQEKFSAVCPVKD
ncbi:hypothetical protein CWC33_06025 [Idiomarina sp. X4]|nr:hypothetical protein CWC33_06025 [Idiomarina sp. X4]